MISTILAIIDGMKDETQIKTKNGVVSVIKNKFGDMEGRKIKGRIKMTRKEEDLCVQAEVGNNIPLVQLDYSQKK